MSSIIINILIIILAISPFIYIFLAGRGKKKIKSEFISKSKQQGINPDKVEAWAHGAMGLDSAQGIFCFQSQLNGNNFQSFKMTEIKNIEVRKEYAPHSGNQPDLSFLKNVSLIIKTDSQQNSTIPIFDSEFDKQVSSELMLANEWQMLLTAYGKSN